MIYNSVLEKPKTLKLKIFDPQTNKSWLEDIVNEWLVENDVEIFNYNLNFSGDKYIISILYYE